MIGAASICHYGYQIYRVYQNDWSSFNLPLRLSNIQGVSKWLEQFQSAITAIKHTGCIKMIGAVSICHYGYQIYRVYQNDWSSFNLPLRLSNIQGVSKWLEQFQSAITAIKYTGCIKMIGAVSICHYGYQIYRVYQNDWSSFNLPLRLSNIQCVSKWLEQLQSAITAIKTHAQVSFPHGTKQEVFKFCVHAQSHSPLLSLGLLRNKAIMATPEQKAFCVLPFVKHESVVSVQRALRRQFSSDPPSANSIRRWYQQFQTTGCLCKGKSAGRPRVSGESVERVRQSFLRSPKKRNICRHVS